MRGSVDLGTVEVTSWPFREAELVFVKRRFQSKELSAEINVKGGGRGRRKTRTRTGLRVQDLAD